MAAAGGEDFYDGRIDRVNDDGTYAIHYADNDREGYPAGDPHHDPNKPGVLRENIRVREVQPQAPPPPQPPRRADAGFNFGAQNNDRGFVGRVAFETGLERQERRADAGFNYGARGAREPLG